MFGFGFFELLLFFVSTLGSFSSSDELWGFVREETDVTLCRDRQGNAEFGSGKDGANLV